jgi:isoleucyl-tRNA synthetase
MSKSLGNQVTPQQVIEQSGADILRLWVVSSDYAEDLRIGPEIIKTNVDSYRKLRNTIRWMLGSLAHFRPEYRVPEAEMPELERLMLSEVARLDVVVREAYEAFDFKRIYFALFNFMTTDLSAFYFDVRKDRLYCDPLSSKDRHAALTVIDRLFDCLVRWLAPMIPFTCDEAWAERHGGSGTVHLELFEKIPDGWRNPALEAKWERVDRLRRVVLGALEEVRVAKKIGSSLEAKAVLFLSDPELVAALEGVDMAEVAIISGFELKPYGLAPEHAFRLASEKDVAVIIEAAAGRKCARSWKYSEEVGSDPDYPDVTLRDAAALREYDSAHQAAE